MQKPRLLTKILLVDDDEDDYLIVRKLLHKVPDGNFKLDWVKSYGQAIEAISQGGHDAYLIDYRLGGHSGLELLTEMAIWERSEPFVILTGAGDRHIEQRAMDMGVADYLVKGTFDAELLSRVLRYALQRKYLEEQRVQHLMEINRSKDEFISLASHQLRTPATVVKQYVAMVLGGYAGDVPELQRDMLTKAYESNELQLSIVNDLLHVAAIDAGRVKLQKGLIDIVELVERLLEEQKTKFDAREQTVKLHKPNQPLQLEADELKLRMVLDNLVDNASKYSDPGSVITVRITATKKLAQVTVSDQGVGIKIADMDKLFQKFSRVDNRLSTEVGGSGLGLYWAKQIIDLHDGQINVKSEPAVGSTFLVRLPKYLAQ